MTGRSRTAYWVCLLLVLATVSWRPSTLYAGGVDSVVLAKAVLSVLALTMAWHARLSCRRPQPTRTAAIWFMLLYVTLSTFGAWSTGDVGPSAVLAIRLLITALTVLLLARTLECEYLLKSWLSAMLTVAAAAAITGLPSVASGRLRGGIPALHPNEMAVLWSLPVVALTWLVFQGRARSIHVLLLVMSMGIVWLTGSRTSVMAIIVAMGVMAVQARRLSQSVLVGAVIALCASVYLAVTSNILDAYFLRGGAESVTTLNSRTIAWSVAFSFSDSDWVRWMGAGLATKELSVLGQYWESQVIDSSWISALVQAGRVGVIVLATWILVTLLRSVSEPSTRRMAFTGFLAFLLVQTFLQSGLVDSAPSFITFLIISLIAGSSSSLRASTRRGPLKLDQVPAVPSSTVLKGHALITRTCDVVTEQS